MVHRFSVFMCMLSIARSLWASGGHPAADYIAEWKDEAIYQMAVYGIPASITLAQGMLESGNGTSRLATKGNNHFGIKCHSDWSGPRIYDDDETRGECFRRYEHACESFEDHSLFLKRKRYESLFSLDSDDYKRWARGLKECGYATNPKYPELLIDLITRYELNQYDREGMHYLKKGEVPERPCGTGHDHEKSAERPRHKHTKDDDKETKDINLSTGRPVLLSANRIRFVMSRAGDTPDGLATELDMMPWQIRRYNDVDENYRFGEGEVVYLQPKRGRGTADRYTTVEGDSLRGVSQQFGIRMAKLTRLNGLTPGAPLAPGSALRLR